MRFLKADTKSQRNSLSKIFKKFVTSTASLPKSIDLFKIIDSFDKDLFRESILMPKVDFFQNPEKLKEIYDEDLGLDILLCNNQLYQ